MGGRIGADGRAGASMGGHVGGRGDGWVGVRGWTGGCMGGCMGGWVGAWASSKGASGNFGESVKSEGGGSPQGPARSGPAHLGLGRHSVPTSRLQFAEPCLTVLSYQDLLGTTTCCPIALRTVRGTDARPNPMASNVGAGCRVATATMEPCVRP